MTKDKAAATANRFRFRAWHPETKRMSEPWDFTDWDGDNLLTLNCVRLDSIVVMQSTGLTDKNGKEIFEGDVVTIRNSAVGEMMKATRGIDPHNELVVWNEGNGCWDFKEYGPMMYEDSDWRECEIIGNVHEHPHLLNGK